MEDSLLADVEALMKHGLEDDRILQQIRRACKNNEAISNYERNYVRNLTEQYQHPDTGSKASGKGQARHEAGTLEQRRSQLMAAQEPAKSRRPYMIIIGVVAAGAVAAAAFAFIMYAGPIDPTNPPMPIQPIPEGLAVRSDSDQYAVLDIISISGTSEQSLVDLSIASPSGDLVWTESVKTRAGGSYSTLILAGGPGWGESGVYVITAYDGSSDTSTFEFSP